VLLKLAEIVQPVDKMYTDLAMLVKLTQYPRACCNLWCLW